VSAPIPFRRGSFSSTLARVLALALLISATAFAGDDSDHGDGKLVLPAPARQLQPTYKVTAGIDGDVFPVFANFASLQTASDREFAVVAVTINNHSDVDIADRISVKITGWSDQEIQTAELGAGKSRTYKFAPTFLPRFYNNHEIAAATAMVEVTDSRGQSIYQTTVPVRLRSVDDIYWGTKFKYAPFIASWVTPHESEVERLLSKAKELAPFHRLPGYEPWKNDAEQEQSTFVQAKAIYSALRQQGVSYVKSSLTFGEHTDITQRVRMPRESLGQTSANCIDAAVMFASLFENLAMDPIVVLVPGHAYVGVRVAKGSQSYLFIDAAMTGRATFEAAVRSADTGLNKRSSAEITRIPIDEAREAGIYPMP
jgi:hypothetical protein